MDTTRARDHTHCHFISTQHTILLGLQGLVLGLPNSTQRIEVTSFGLLIYPLPRLKAMNSIHGDERRVHFGQGRGATRSSFLLLTLNRPVLYIGPKVRDYRSNRNVFFACLSHAVWCPKYRRKVLVGPIEARLKQMITDVCQEHQADIEEKNLKSCPITSTCW